MAVIAFDLDDTLLDQLTQLIVWHNRVYGTRLRGNDYVDHSLQTVWKTDDAETTRRVTFFHASVESHAIRPFPGVHEELFLLHRAGHVLHMVTGRPSGMRARTEVLVGRFFPRLFRALHFCNSYRTADRVSKATVCRRIGADLLVDDVFDHGKECVDAGITALLVDQEWNRHHVDLPAKMHRIQHISEVRNFLR